MAVRTSAIHRMKVSDGIVEHFTSRIINGDYKAGDKLPSERALAVSLGVSRTALREAVRTLSLMNLLTVKHGGGTYIADICPGSFMKPLSPMLSMGNINVLELIEARRIIEPEAASLCALRASDEELSEIGAMVEKMAATVKDLKKFNDLDLGFHIALAVGSHNSVLTATLEAIRDALFQQVQEVQELPGAAERALKYHTKLAEAVLNRNEKMAAKGMLEHLNDVETAVLSSIRKRT